MEEGKHITARVEQENDVLACCFVDEEAAAKAVDKLRVDDFVGPLNRLIFGAISGLYGREMISIMTVRSRMERDGALGDGVWPHLLDLSGSLPSTQMIDWAIGEVLDASIRRRLYQAAQEAAALALDPRVENPQAAAMAKVMAVQGGRGDDTVRHVEAAALEHYQAVEARELAWQTGADMGGLKTGFYDLDRFLVAGPGDLIIIAGRPAMGKTAFSLNLLTNISGAKTGLLFSLEMATSQIVARMMAGASGVPMSVQHSATLSKEQWSKMADAVTDLGNLKLWIDDRAAPTVGQMLATAKRIQAGNGGEPLGIVMVDYLQLITPTSQKAAGDPRLATTEISRALKIMARELGCPVIALSQLSRAVESRQDKRPMLSDLRESGSIEQDADIVGFLYRDEYYNPKTAQPGLTELIIAKHRQGPTKTVELYFSKETTKFESVAYSGQSA